MPKSAFIAASPWQPVKFRIQAKDGTGLREKRGHSLGPVAVYEESEEQAGQRWTVASVAADRKLCLLSTESEAKRVGEELSRRLPKLLSQADPRKLRQGMPDWAKPWLTLCERLGRWTAQGLPGTDEPEPTDEPPAAVPLAAETI